jgi:ketosteroid isomerase-like protein
MTDKPRQGADRLRLGAVRRRRIPRETSLAGGGRRPGSRSNSRVPRLAETTGTELRVTGAEPSHASQEIEEWLARFEAAVRARDFEAGRALFAPDAIAFGTRAEMARGIDDIMAQQWRHVWPHIHDFRLGARVTTVTDDTGWVATMWQTTRPQPVAFPRTRRGRGTFVLERRDGQWVAVHSHFSMVPEDPQL